MESIGLLDLPSCLPSSIDWAVDGVHRRSTIGPGMLGLQPYNVRPDLPLRPISVGEVQSERGRGGLGRLIISHETRPRSYRLIHQSQSCGKRGMNLLLNSCTACAINVYLALGSSFFVPRVGLAKALLVSMIRPLAATVGSLSHRSATF
jgi:hypothetical protein